MCNSKIFIDTKIAYKTDIHQIYKHQPSIESWPLLAINTLQKKKIVST